MPLPMAILDLSTSAHPLEARVVAINDAMDGLVVGPGDSALGRRVGDFTLPHRRAMATEHLGRLASLQLDGYELSARVRRTNGTVLEAPLWVRRLHSDNGHTLAAVTVAPSDLAMSELAPVTVASCTINAGVIVTDGSWIIEQSSDGVAAILEVGQSSLIGHSVLRLIHEQDTPPFLLAVAQTIASRQTVIVRLRLKGDSSWHDATCLITAFSEDDPLSLGIVITSPDARLEQTPSDLQARLMRMVEERTAGRTALPTASTSSADNRLRKLAELSPRQREIVARLLAGERAPQIAKAMFLSPSTVRNHLTAVFRKFGVHSQVELIALLRQSLDPRQGDVSD